MGIFWSESQGKMAKVESKYHRFLNRAKWNSVQLSKILFGVLIHCLPSTSPILIAVDETIERRKGKHIKAKGCYLSLIHISEPTRR